MRRGERTTVELNWLPLREDWNDLLRSAKSLPAPAATPVLRALANSRMEFPQLLRLDRTLVRLAQEAGGTVPGLERVRLAVLGSSTLTHLLPGVRIAGLRRGLLLEIYEAPFGTYRQELFDNNSGLHRFAPQALLLALDARHIAAAGTEDALAAMHACWRQARTSFSCQVLQQTVLPVFPELLGNNEERLAHSPAASVADVNQRLRSAASDEAVDLLALDRLAARDGLASWYSAGLWHHSKEEVHPRASEMYGEHVARLIAAARGRSAKCLVLDLDNTLWGGVIGDEGVEGIVLGQGTAAGEAFLEFQQYVKALAARGVVLAVCSKNDEPNARSPFERHPEMLLRCNDIACFVANWTDKAANLRAIANKVDLGLDTLVFVDDNPVERALIRRELPEVAVPELPEDPAEYAATLSAAGYFEALRTTEEDRARGDFYRGNAERAEMRETATDIEGYLQSLRMALSAGPVDKAGLARVTQLVNKTNQFNLTTRRRTEAEVAALMADPCCLTLQARLTDRFGDNGIIAVVIVRVRGQEAIIENWLMSCRVLGRRVEEACLNVLAEMAAARGVRRLVGEYVPTEKNALVREMYPKLGFTPAEASGNGATRWELALARFQPHDVPIAVETLVRA